MEHTYFVVLAHSSYVMKWIHLIMMNWLCGCMKDRPLKEDSMEDLKNLLMFAILGGYIQPYASLKEKVGWINWH